MKLAQELRAGTVIKIGSDVLIVQKADYSKSGRNSAVVKLKFKNLVVHINLMNCNKYYNLTNKKRFL